MSQQERMTAEEYQALISKKRSKYGSQKTVVDGITFDSKAEANYYILLKEQQRAGEIKGFLRQPSFPLSAVIRYRPDFMVCGKNGHIWFVDVKGYETDVFKVKHKLLRENYPWIDLRIVKQ